MKLLKDIINQHNPELALKIYDAAILKFSDNPELILLGSQIYLELNNLKLASANLSRIKKASFSDQYVSLQEKITRKLSDQNKIVTKIEENKHNNIVLFGVLNNSVRQKFILDTGASLVTIPSSTANMLGLFHVPYTIRTVATASGTIQAREVSLHSISINGKTTYDIPVVIMDLPQQAGVGLLGMSFLKKFHMELNGQQKELLLTPIAL